MTSEFDDSIWEQTPDATRPLDARLEQRAVAFLDGAASVLDLGCGDGQYLGLLGEHCGQVFGADRSTVALERAARRAPAAALHEVPPNERLPLADNSVERVWCVDTIEHVHDTQVVLSEARRVLAPGGQLLVATPAHGFGLRLKLAFSGWDRHFDPFSPHLRFYTRSSLQAALMDCGFGPVDVDAPGGMLVAVAQRA